MSGLCWCVHARDGLSGQVFERLRLGLDVQRAAERVRDQPLGDRNSLGVRRLLAREPVGEREYVVALGEDLPASDGDGGGARGGPWSSGLSHEASQRPCQGVTVPGALQLGGTQGELRAAGAIGSVRQHRVETVSARGDP
jgi:hypothetical protein